MPDKNNPLVTIVTPSFNQGDFIEETICSVLNQTYPHIQYIIVDGGSSDHTMQIVEKYKSQIDIIIHEKDNGQTDAINKGFRLAKGELVGWINSDDILYADCVERIVELYNKWPDKAIYYSSSIDIIDTVGKIIRTTHLPIQNIEHLLNKEYSINQQGSFYNIRHIKRINYLDEDIHYCMDLDLFLRLLREGGICNFNSKPLAGFRMWGETKTTTGQNRFMKEIRDTLWKYGANRLASTIIKTYKFDLIFILKRLAKR